MILYGVFMDEILFRWFWTILIIVVPMDPWVHDVGPYIYGMVESHIILVLLHSVDFCAKQFFFEVKFFFQLSSLKCPLQNCAQQFYYQSSVSQYERTGIRAQV